LGLLVGGIGIANTMQVLLRRRQREIAIWKTIGYRESQLLVMFALEAALLGILGSLLGAGAGVLVSSQLVELFRRTSNLLFAWTFSTSTVLAGIAVGILTTIIFALWAIVIASRAQPVALLRNEPVDAKQLPKWKSAGLAALLSLPFMAVTSLAMGSLINGVIVLLFALAGLAALGGFFSGLIWLVTRLLPLRGFPLMHMAQNSLRRRGASLVFAMIALFVGVVSMTLGTVVTQTGQREMSAHTVQIKGFNLNVLAPWSEAAAVRQAIQAQPSEKTAYGSSTTVKSIQAVDQPERSDTKAVLIGRSDPSGYQVSGALWGSQPQGVYSYKYSGIAQGGQVVVTLVDGSTRKFSVVGTYDLQWDSINLYPQLGLLMPVELALQTAPPDTLIYFVQAPAGKINTVAAALGAALPGATVINLMAYATRFLQTYRNLFVLAMAMAGLALLAGILLVANAVSLAMLDRRYEIGVLKTMGYSRRHILTSLAVEYSSVSLMACSVGLLAVRIFLWVVGLSNPMAGNLLVLTPLATALIVFCGVGLPLLTILGVTWSPTRVSPLLVLNDRG
ncbi:MAG: FtsX-like permease family protein, partial [Anaerolineaceae bacterium]|nr:FtsX-like permease family protein [Anaerolineaceae bacterium]